LTEIADMLADAARTTLGGAAEVTLSQRYDIEGVEPGAVRLVGTADFAGDRCRLDGDGDGEAFVFDGEDEYRQVEGRWERGPRRPGRRSSSDPSWLLRLLADPDAVHDLAAGADGEIRGELAYDRADATLLTGVFRGWRLPFTVEVVDGTVRTAHLEKVDGDSGRVGVVDHLELRPLPSVDPIEIPIL
jgi:hypothetical protein